MACPAIITGDNFVLRMLAHIDCQSRYLGSYGYQALGEPGSFAATVMAGVLTLFVAMWGFRLLFGALPLGRDVVSDVLKVGIVLALAFSWPAFRTVIHDVVLDGPAQIADSLGTPGIASTASGFAERLQGVDNAIVRFTELGAGRNIGGFIDDAAVGGTFAGSALEDQSAFGWSRLIYLVSLIGSLALVRLLAGLLLAVAPLAAGLLLFEATRGLFSGWLRGLVLCLIATVGLTIILAVELAVLEPWLSDALRVRALGYAAPSAPLELFAVVAAFGIVKFLAIWLLAKVAFSRGWVSATSIPTFDPVGSPGQAERPALEPAVTIVSGNRAQRLADQMKSRIENEQRTTPNRTPELRDRDETEPTIVNQAGDTQRLGSSYRRNIRLRSLRTLPQGSNR